MSVCKFILGGVAAIAATKFIEELARTGDAEEAAWSTMESASNVTESAANWTANAARNAAVYAKEMLANNNPEAQEGVV